MKFEWPELITLQFKTKGNKVHGVLVIMSILSKVKNNFSIGPLFVDEKGIILLEADHLREIIEDEKRKFPMDYDGELEDCNGFELVVESKKDLLERANRIRKYYPDVADDLDEKISGCSNEKFATFKGRWELPISNKVIAIDLK